jgi:glycosyltransferase involved in cell wall biosynthesis
MMTILDPHETSIQEISSKPADIPSFLEKRICVVLTAYDDEDSIGDSVKDFLAQRNVVEVIVVDNNCSDSTAQEAKVAGAKIAVESSQGYGFACIGGLREALLNNDAEIIVLAEGDMTFRGRDIWKLLPFTDDADLVLGSRTNMSFVESKAQMDWFYSWGNLFLAKLLEFRFFNSQFFRRTRLTDVGCTFRAINRKALMMLVDDLKIGGNHFSPHMIKLALKKGLRVIEVPITFHERVGQSKGAGSSRKNGLKIGLKMLWEIIS